MWSQVNREHVARLTEAGRMTPHGQREIDAAKADGRWAAAYAPMRTATENTVPADVRAAIDASPRARKTFQTLGRRNLLPLYGMSDSQEVRSFFGSQRQHLCQSSHLRQ